MDRQGQEHLRQRLVQKKHDLTARLERIRSNLQRGLDPDSAERAKQLEDSDVVDALGKDVGVELVQIAATLRRMDEGQFGVCIDCGHRSKTPASKPTRTRLYASTAPGMATSAGPHHDQRRRRLSRNGSSD